MEEQRVTCRHSGKIGPRSSQGQVKKLSQGKNRSALKTLLSHTPGSPDSEPREKPAQTRCPASRRRGAPAGATRLGRRGARAAASPARRRPSSPPSSPGRGGGRRRGRAAAPGARRLPLRPPRALSRNRAERAACAGVGVGAARRQSGRRRKRLDTQGPHFGLGRRLGTRQPPRRTWGGETGKDPRKEGYPLGFPC